MSLIRKIEGAIADFDVQNPDSPDTIEIAEKRDEFVMGNAFTPQTYGKFESLFTKSKPISVDGRLLRYSGVISNDIDKLFEKLFYNSKNHLDAQVGKYIALLIGLREVASMARVESEHEKRQRLLQIVGTTNKKLQNFSFYDTSDAVHALRAGYGSGSTDYMPRIAKLYHPTTQQRVA